MTRKQTKRKLWLTLHLLFSLGWVGAVLAYLALSIAGLASADESLVRAAYRSMELIGWGVIVPLSLGALATGLIQSLVSPWGLFRHWWVVAKLGLTVLAVAVLLSHMGRVSEVASLAQEGRLGGEPWATRLQLTLHPGAGLGVLMAILLISSLKPWGLTPYGLKLSGRKSSASEEAPAVVSREPSHVERRSATGPTRWLVITGAHAIGLALLGVVAHLAWPLLRSH